MTMSAAQAQAASDAFYAAAVSRSVRMPSVQVQSGGLYNLTMPNAGYGRFLMLTFVGTISCSSGATVTTVTATSRSPWNIINSVNFTDYAGLQRISAVSGATLNQRRRILTPKMDTTLYYPGQGADKPDQADYFTFSIPAQTASTVTTAPVVFTLLVPFSALYNSVRGSFPFTVPNGQSVVQFSILPEQTMLAQGATADPDNVVAIAYTAGATTTVSFSGTVYPTYYYYDAPAGAATPVSEISEVYELVTVNDTSNLLGGNTKQFILQTGRTYLRIYQHLVMQGAEELAATLQSVAFKVDASTPVLDEWIQSYINRLANHYGQMPGIGELVWDFSAHPWTPDSYGSLETDLTILAAANNGAPTYLKTTRECLYVSQQAPNLVQSGSAA